MGSKNKMRKIYIAGKITGLDKEQINANFRIAKLQCIAMGFMPVCPLELEHNHEKTWSAYMKEDMAAMLQCDAVYAQVNWSYSKGATIEINTALSIGMKVIHQKHFKLYEKDTANNTGFQSANVLTQPH
jgi:nucleoside 2-deoxyribosyltransferase